MDASTIINLISAAILALVALIWKRTSTQVDDACRAITKMVTDSAITMTKLSQNDADHIHFHKSIDAHRVRLEDHSGKILILEHEYRCEGFKPRRKEDYKGTAWEDPNE